MNERDGEIKGRAGSRAVQVLVALGKGVCYLALFLGMQVLVVLPVAVAAGVQSAMGNWEAAEQLYGVLYESATALSAVSGLLTIAAVLLFYLIRRKKLEESLWLRRVEGPGLLAGAALAPGQTGAMCFDARTGEAQAVQAEFVAHPLHGTGDVFASVLTGALIRGDSLRRAAALAVDFIHECAVRTVEQGLPLREGVDFEPLLGRLLP